MRIDPPLTPPTPPPEPGRTRNLLKNAPVIIVGSVMFSFISYWRVAAVVLCDMASTAYYIGGIAEQIIGAAAPWLILGVMLFSYAVGSVYIESCGLFVRGGVYRVVKEALGSLPAKGAVSALLFDYVLTGPISSVSAGQYLVGWLLDFLVILSPDLAIQDVGTRLLVRRGCSILIAIAITLYFFRKNLIGIHESSGKAVGIVLFTTAVALIVLIWCAITLAVRGPVNSVPMRPDLSLKVEYETVIGPDRVTGEVREMWRRDPQTGRLVVKQDDAGHPVPRINLVTGHQEDPLGFLPSVFPWFAEKLRASQGALSFLGLFGLLIAFGHSILALSGEETLAQVYREVESPKLKNFKKAAFIIFTYSLILTGSVSFLAVLMIPDEVRMKDYADNLLGGLAMYVIGPPVARLILNALVVVAGFLILAGAVNTSMIGSNGVLNRVAEDGVLPDRLQRPHPKYGTTYRILYLIVGLQLFTIIASGGNMIVLGEAYAFGVIWSFLFNALSMLVLRYRDRTPREFKVPLNIQIGRLELPIGLGLIFLLLASTALVNLFTKEVATLGGMTFASIFLATFIVTERQTVKGRRGVTHEHLEQFTEQATPEVSSTAVGLSKPYRKLVAIRSPQNLYMLQKTLEETDPDTTDVIVMTAKTLLPGGAPEDSVELDRYDRRLMTAVIDLAEKAGKRIKPLVVPTNNPLFAVINTARSLNVQELIVGASNKYTAEEQADQMAFYWINLNDGHAAPITMRLLTQNIDIHNDIGGGCRIPTISERKARSVSELRDAGVGVRRTLLAHDATAQSSDVFEAVLTMLDPEVVLDLVRVPGPDEADLSAGAGTSLEADCERARKLGRTVTVHAAGADPGPDIVQLARDQNYDVILLSGSAERTSDGKTETADWVTYVQQHATGLVAIFTPPSIPREVTDTHHFPDPGTPPAEAP